MADNNYSPFVSSMQDTLQRLQGSVQRFRQQKPSTQPPTERFPNLNQAVKGTRKQKLGTITTPFGGGTRYEGYHPGLDIANRSGTPIPVWPGGSGMVKQVVTGQIQGAPGYGNYVIIQDEQGNRWRYSHLANAYVQVGQPIRQGQVLGTMGNTGQTYSESGGTGTHLDIRIKDIYGRYINPLKFLRRT